MYLLYGMNSVLRYHYHYKSIQVAYVQYLNISKALKKDDSILLNVILSIYLQEYS